MHRPACRLPRRAWRPASPRRLCSTARQPLKRTSRAWRHSCAWYRAGSLARCLPVRNRLHRQLPCRRHPPLPHPRHRHACTPLCRLIGQAAHALQEYGQAELAYRRALDVRADCLPAWVGLARLFAATGNTAGAVEANERAVGAAPSAHIACFCTRACCAAAVHVHRHAQSANRVALPA